MIDFKRDKKLKGMIITVIVMFTLVSVTILPNALNNKGFKDLTIKDTEQPVSFAVSTGTSESTRVGEQILKEGGNAVDAAIAVSFSLGVTSPQNSGIGGGGVMLVYDPSLDEAFYYDFYNASGNYDHGNHIGIPGFLKGMGRVFEDYGSLSLDDLLEYPIQQAKKGIIVDKYLSQSIMERPFIAEVNEAFLNKDTVIREGDILIQEQLADTYESIREEGFNVLYDGVSDLSLNFSESSKIDVQSLSMYEARKYNAIETSFKNKKLIAVGSPFSGATTIQMLKLLDHKAVDFVNGIDEIEIKKYDDIYNFAFNDNALYVGDTDWSRNVENLIVEDHYISENFVEGLAYLEDFNESENTISYSIIDKNGMVVVGTNTLSNHWGSLVSRDGYFFNNSLKNFSSTDANVWGPQKRPKTFISPLILLDEDDIVAIGSSGGNTIPQVISMLVSMNETFNIPYEQAIDTQRFAKDKDLYFVEHRQTRSNVLVNDIKNTYQTLYYSQNNFFNAITLSIKENGEFDALYEVVNCKETCAASHTER